MVTFEDITEMFLSAAEATGLSVHPEFWLNSQTLEREFACTIHPGPCEEAEQRAACTVSFAWGPLDTALSLDGAEAICDFFHEPDEHCPHLHTGDVPPLALELTYSVPLNRMHFTPVMLQTLARTMRLRASEHSSRAVETRPMIALSFDDNGIQADSVTLQQHVELPIWNPERLGGFALGEEHGGTRFMRRSRRASEADSGDSRPEDWLPHLFAETLSDIANVIAALESSHAPGKPSGMHDSSQDN